MDPRFPPRPPGAPGEDNTEVQSPTTSATRMPVLLVVGDAALGGAPGPGPRVLALGAQGLVAGRNIEPSGQETLWRLTHRRASGRHARVRRLSDVCLLEDLGSTNGTLRNGLALSAPVALQDGDIVFMGGHAAVFRWLSLEEERALAEARRSPMGPIATSSPLTALAEMKLKRIAASEHEILLVGETGVGKEVYAEAIHKASGRAGPLVPVNCAALPGELVESELFGYVRGAHSQANQTKRGLIEEAEGGTLFLDEIGDMPQTAQAKLLRFLQSREIVPLGSTRPRRVDVRVLAATSRPGGGNGSPGLREDLIGRMGAAAFTLPPLRTRREDLGVLMHHFTRQAAGGVAPALDAGTFLALCLYPWPRNVRELKKVVETAVLLAAGAPEVGLLHLPEELAQLVSGDGITNPTDPVSGEFSEGSSGGSEVRFPPADSAPTTDAAGAHALPPDRRRSPRPLPRRDELVALLTAHQGNVSEVARALDRHWKVIKRALDRHGLEADRFRSEGGP